MATIEPPTKSSTVSNAKTRIKVTDTPAPDEIKPLQLKIPAAQKNDFKAFAALRGRNMNDMFIEMYTEYKEKHA